MPRYEQEIMNGWRFALVPAEPKRVNGIVFEEKDTLLSEQEVPSEEAFEKISLPHDWAINRPFNRRMEQGEQQGFRDRWGIGWYRRELFLEEKKDGYRYYLEFGAIYENSTVWVNGGYAGGRRYGYSPFRLEITELISAGTNDILIRVDNTLSPADRWYSGCGIYRTVKFLEVEEHHLDLWETVVTTHIRGTDGVVEVWPHAEGVVKAVLTERGGFRETGKEGAAPTAKAFGGPEAGAGEEAYSGEQAHLAEAVGDGTGSLTLTVPDAKLWSADAPNLYDLSLTLLDGERECDTIRMAVGVREAAFVPEKGLFINGKKETLRGVCLHQEAGCAGIAVRKELWRERLAALKEMGCNAIRAAHHVYAEEFLDLCDEMGFYVYEECFDKWTGGLYARYFATEWRQDVEAMVMRDRNRPSILIWGVGNEVEKQGQPSMLIRLRMLVDKVKSMDMSRPVAYAMNPHFSRETNIDMSQVKDIQKLVDEVSNTEIYDNAERVERISRIGEIVDLLGCNYQEQWYPLIHEALPDKLILGTESYQYFCGHPDHMQNFTERVPSLVPEQYDYCIGSMIWTGIDYLGESMGYPAKGWSGSMIRTNGERRPSYYILQSYWTKEPMIHLSVMDYSLQDEGGKEHWDLPIYADHWHFPQFLRTVIPYMVATNCESVELFVGEKHFAAPKPSECANRLITGFVPWIPGRIRAVGYIGGKAVCSHELVTPGPAVRMEFDGGTRRLPAQEGYELLLTARAKDEAGNPYFRESAVVRFRVEGPASLAAVDNGNLCDSEPFDESFLHMYHGCASALIRLDGRPGRVVVWADAEGMQSGRSVILVEG